MTKYDWIDIREEPQVGKTRRFTVCKPGSSLFNGLIVWHGPFDSYVFRPGVCVVFEADCLRDIAAAIEELNAEHKRKAKGYY